MMFATFVIEREPTRLADLLPVLIAWLQSVGAIACFGLVLYFAATLFHPRSDVVKISAMKAADEGFLARFGSLGIFDRNRGAPCAARHRRPRTWASGNRAARSLRPGSNPDGFSVGDYLFAGSGLLALLVVAGPVIRWLFVDASPTAASLRHRPASTLKEAMHRQVIFVFGAFSLVFLFAEWFIQYKAEHQVRNYVFVFYWTMLPLFLL